MFARSPVLNLLQDVPVHGPAGVDAAPDPVVASGAGDSLWDALTWPDQVGLVVLGTFLVLGAVRGLWWQVIRLAGLLFAGILARSLAPRFSGSLAESSGLPVVVSQGLTWFTIFVVGLVAASLLGMIGKKSLEMMQLGLVDRFGGALAGLLTGVSLQAVLLVLLSYLGPQPWTADTLRGTRSERLLRLVSGRLPVFVDRESAAAREIRAWIGSDGEVHAAPPGGAPDEARDGAGSELAPSPGPEAPASDPTPSRVR